MITGVIKNKIDKIWTDIWGGGITNPLTVIEQLTYLMFIRSLDEKELENEEFANLTGETADLIFPQSEIGQAMRLSKFKDRDSREIFDLISQRVFPAVKKMKYGKLPDFDDRGELIEIPDRGDEEQVQTAFSRYMDSAVFVIPNPQVLQKIITGLDDLYEHDIADLDMQGDLYEYMLGKLSTAGQNGQFRTPKHIREMMVELVAPTPDDLICDPACGSGGMFIQSGDFVNAAGMHANSAMTFYGQEKVEYNAQLCLMNMAVHGLKGVFKSGDEANTFYHDAHRLNGKCDYVMANVRLFLFLMITKKNDSLEL